MARVTVEDCLALADNRFQLVLAAARRARQLSMGADAMLPWEGDKPTVMALREIAEGKVDPRALRDARDNISELVIDEEPPSSHAEYTIPPM